MNEGIYVPKLGRYWKEITIVVLGLIIVLGVSTYLLSKLIDDVYETAYNDGVSNLVTQINSNGEIPVITQTGAGESVEMIEIQTICQQQGGIQQ